MTKILFLTGHTDEDPNLYSQLRGVGYTLIICRSEEEAVKSLFTSLPDVILCDISDSGMRNCEILKLAKSEDETFNIPFIVISSEFDSKIYRSAVQMGADDFLKKPMRLDELLSAITSQLEKRDRRGKISEKQFESLRMNIAKALPHEFNTPLTAILGFTETLRTEFKNLTMPEIIEMLEYMDNSAHRLRATAEKFLLFTNLESVRNSYISKDYQVHSTTFVTKNLITQTVADINEFKSRSKDVKVNVGECRICFFQEYFEAVIRELVENALKYSDPGTKISIAGKVVEGRYILEITDRGLGLPQEFVNEIGAFKQYRRHKYEQQGLGLGLAIVKESIRLFGGELVINSAPGEGSVVSMLLKVAE